VSEKRAEGVFIEMVSQPTESGDRRYAGEFSVIVRLYTKNGRHIGTLHQMIDSSGTVLVDRHPPHPRDYTLRDCSRVRTLHKQEMEPQPRKRRRPRRTTIDEPSEG
jgi:hypothetical protein